jgi:Fe-S oxidoreductase
MSLPIGQVIGLLSDNLRLRGSVFPIPSRRVTGWARGLDLPQGGPTVLYTGQMYQLIPYIETAVGLMERVATTPLASLTGLGRRANRVVNLTGLAIHPSAATRAPYDEVLRDIATLLRQAGVEFGYLYAEDHYSGALAHDLGLDAEVARHARMVTAMFRRRGVTEVITVDPHTTHLLRSVYPTLVDGYDLRVRSYLEVLAERLPDADNLLGEDVALHDSCVLARYEGIIDEPRTLLARAGLTVREPANTKAMTWCCGGPVEALYPAKARASAERRVAQLRQAAGSGVTMCPLCLVNLRKGANGTLPVQDISHYLRRAYPHHQQLVARQATGRLSTGTAGRPAS